MPADVAYPGDFLDSSQDACMSPESHDVGDVYPSLTYADASAAIEWLCAAFGFERRLLVPGDDGDVRHSELSLGRAVVMVSSPKPDQGRVAPTGHCSSALSVYVADPDAHYERAVAHGAEVVHALQDEEYGARGYQVLDLEGRLWYFGSYRPGRWWNTAPGTKKA